MQRSIEWTALAVFGDSTVVYCSSLFWEQSDCLELLRRRKQDSGNWWNMCSSPGVRDYLCLCFGHDYICVLYMVTFVGLFVTVFASRCMSVTSI